MEQGETSMESGDDKTISSEGVILNCSQEGTSSYVDKESGPRNNKPVCLIILGMAGSGKSTLVQKISSYLYSKQKPPYILNLDPACREVSYPANIGECFTESEQFYTNCS